MGDARLDALGNAGTPEERRTGLGGSDAAASMGLSPWRTQLDLWEEKRGLAPPVDENEPMLWGKLLEDIIRREYARRVGVDVHYSKDMIRDPVRPWMFAHLDGRIDDRTILEVKTSRTGQGWGEPDTDEIPLPYLIQVHHSLVVTSAQVCDIAVLIGGSDFRLYQVERDLEIEQHLIEGEAAFWQSVTDGVPPPPMSVEDAVKRWGRFDATGYMVAGEAEIAAVETLRALHREKKELEAREEGAKLALMQVLGANGQALVHPDGELLATWKLDKGRKGYVVAAREPSRRFLVKHLEEA